MMNIPYIDDGCARRVGRHAYLMKIDSAYCDVIVQRWEEFTGRKAERASR